LSTAQLQHRLEDYWSWLRDETELRAVDNGSYVEITTPFLDRHNDYLQIYARRASDEAGWELTDDGYTLRDLEMSGCDFSTEKRSQLLKVTLQRLGVQKDGYALTVRASEDNFPQKKHDLVQAMLAVGDLFHTASATVIGLFLEEVEQWLDENEIRYTESIKLPGASGYDHHFDFVIPGFQDVPERVLQAINRPGRSNVERLIMAWEDTRDARPRESEAIAILNDVEKSVPQGSLEALANYDIKVLRWSERDEHVEELAA
jgi:hypothetical protein